MTFEQFSEALRSGRRVYGTLVASTSSRWVPLLAGLPIDFVFIDTEHLPIGCETLGWMCQAYGFAGLPPIVRVASPDPVAAGQAVDFGAAGVVAPYVEDAAQARDLVAAVKLRPLKGAIRQRAAVERATLPDALRAYVANYSASRSVIVNIESTPALENLEAILAVPGVDAVLVGPHDLSCSMGIPDEYENPVFERAVTGIFRKARAAGIAAGIHSWMPLEREAGWCEAGANLMIHGSDLNATREMVVQHIGALRRRMGDSRRNGNDAGAAIV